MRRTRVDALRRRWVSFWAIFRREFRQTGRPFAILMVVMAVFFGAAFLFLSDRDTTRQRVAEDNSPVAIVAISLVDEDQSIVGKLARQHLKAISYVKDVYDDTLEQAMARLDRDEVILVMYLPPGLFTAARHGEKTMPVKVWLNPHTPNEAAKIGNLIRRYENTVRAVYNRLYGYQKLSAEMLGDTDDVWNEMTQFGWQVVFDFVGRGRFVYMDEFNGYDPVLHAVAGVLVALAMIPAFGVLSSTVRMARSPMEERLTAATGGMASQVLARLLVAVAWWAVLEIPALLALEKIGFLLSRSVAIWPLFFLAVGQALLLYEIGRIKADPATLVQTGWLLFLVAQFLGGVLYPVTLFPVWLQGIAKGSPVYPVMESVSAAMASSRATLDVGPSLRPLAVGLLAVVLAWGARQLRTRQHTGKAGGV